MQTTFKILLTAAIFSLGQVNAQEPGDSTPWINYYDHQQSEQLLDAAAESLERYQFRDAEHGASQALQAIKANYGLFSERQFPALELLIESLLAQGRWQAIEQQLSYFEWLVARTYDSNLEAFLQGTDSLSRLFLAAAANNNHPNSARYLVAAKNLNWRAVTAIESSYGRNSLLLPPRLYDISLIHFYQSSLSRRKWLTSHDFKSESPELVNGWALSKTESLQKSYNIGHELLQRIRAIYQNSELNSALVEARMFVYLGDWETLFDHYPVASNYYTLAHEILSTSQLGELEISEYFKQTTVIPELSLSVAGAEFISSNDQTPLSFVSWSTIFPGATAPLSQRDRMSFNRPDAAALVQFDLAVVSTSNEDSTVDGTRARFTMENPKLLNAGEFDGVIQQQVLREIEDLKFRPQFAAGKAISSRNNQLQYFFIPQTSAVVIGNLR